MEVDVEENPFAILRKITDIDGRGDHAFPQVLDAEIIGNIFVHGA
jgi:hypothetical protein